MSFANLPTGLNTCAIIVTYFPDVTFLNNLQRVLIQFPYTIIIDNGTKGDSAHLLHEMRDQPGLEIFANSANLGIAAALNQGVKLALERGYEWVVTLDQDTTIFPNFLKTLMGIHLECLEDQVHVIVGGNYRDMHRQKDYIKCRPSGQNFVERKTLITSGTLASARFIEEIGGFREDYFIDSVDHEFCLRARSHGCKVVITCKSIMSHSIGASIKPLGWLSKFSSFNHSPTRKYFIARNTVVTVKNYFLREPAWSLRQLWRLLFDVASLLLFEQKKAEKAKAFLIGILDGLRGKMGAVDKYTHPPNG